jgi:hypothetical protein
MCAYLQKNNTINAIMGLALNEANLDMGRKDDIFDCICLDGNGSFEPKELATLVVFRTIEVSHIQSDITLTTHDMAHKQILVHIILVSSNASQIVVQRGLPSISTTEAHDVC